MFKKTGIIFSMLLLAVALVAAGCGGSTPAPEAPETPALSGNIAMAGSTSVQPLAEELAMAFMGQNSEVKIDVAGGGSGAGVESAGNGAADIGMASRDVKSSEKESYPEIVNTVIANDGITVVVNNANQAVSELTSDQVKGIFDGSITNWSEVGGDDVAITVVNREEGSGTRGAFHELVIGKEGSFTEAAVIQSSTGAVKTAVAADEFAVGYISMGSMNSDVKGIIVDGAEPSIENVLNGSYTIARPFNLLTQGEPDGLSAEFINWIMSEEGQAIVTENGFIPVK